MDSTNKIVIAVLLVVALLFALLLLIKILIRLNSFQEELRYINMELGRCSVQMRPKWRRRRRRLWCSLLIPFYKY